MHVWKKTVGTSLRWYWSWGESKQTKIFIGEWNCSLNSQSFKESLTSVTLFRPIAMFYGTDNILQYSDLNNVMRYTSKQWEEGAFRLSSGWPRDFYPPQKNQKLVIHHGSKVELSPKHSTSYTRGCQKSLDCLIIRYIYSITCVGLLWSSRADFFGSPLK